MSFSCPAPEPENKRILSGHGSGGLMTDQLVRDVFLAAFGSDGAIPHDAAPVEDMQKVFVTTDAHVVQPLFFPGGDIGTLAVNGTVNDLLMAGAKPLALTASFMLGEGLPMATLRRVVASMQQAAEASGVRIIAGDTKVVSAVPGEAETLYISTTGIGGLAAPQPLKPERISADDVIILTGDIGRHGVAVLAARHDLELPAHIQSDCASLEEPLLDLFEAGVELHCARDATRGGLGGILHELAEACGVGMTIREADIPIQPEVSAVCGILGFDPLFLANEGCAVLFAAEADAPRILEILRRHPQTQQAACIGRVTPGTAQVILHTALGTERLLTPPAGELLPRIC